MEAGCFEVLVVLTMKIVVIFIPYNIDNSNVSKEPVAAYRFTLSINNHTLNTYGGVEV
jgi:hypothetical protein